MSHDEPLNEPNGVFDWTDFDGEPLVGTHHVVNDLHREGTVGYDRADDDINDEQGSDDYHSDDDSDNDNHRSVDSSDDNDNDGRNNGGVQIANEQDVANRDEVDQPREAFELNVEETTRCGESNVILARNLGSESREVGKEDNVPIGDLFTTHLARSTPSVGTVLAGLGRAPPCQSYRPPRHHSGKRVTPTLNSRAAATSSGTAPRVGPSTRNRGVKRSIIGPQNVRPFCSGYTTRTSSSSEAIVGTRGINEDGITDRNKRRKVKKIVTTMVDGTIDSEVRNINSTVEEYVPNAYGDEDEVCRDDEGSDGSDDSRAEVPNDEDIVVRAPLEMAGTRKNPRRRTSGTKND